tara:strand:+ start:615 stop:992 length:378 start_codon:yes stop_codon:yes gene_type:complete
MNPDHIYNNNDHTIWILTDADGNSVKFKVPRSGNTVTISDHPGGGGYQCHKDTAREKWKSYMDKGYRLVNKMPSVNRNSKIEKQEKKYDVMKSIHASMDDFVKSHKMKDAKKLYTDNWNKYALEA